MQLPNLASDAAPCPACGTEAFGMLKTPAYTSRGVDYPPVFEVGCLGCRAGHRARAITIEGAVAKWNAGDFVK